MLNLWTFPLTRQVQPPRQLLRRDGRARRRRLAAQRGSKGEDGCRLDPHIPRPDEFRLSLRNRIVLSHALVRVSFACSPKLD
jgi:hypothetical protein